MKGTTNGLSKMSGNHFLKGISPCSSVAFRLIILFALIVFTAGVSFPIATDFSSCASLDWILAVGYTFAMLGGHFPVDPPRTTVLWKRK
jgi:hypothetical protein